MTECGANTRNGKPCKRAPMSNGRCHNHGGSSTGPPIGTKNALTHGIYSDAILEGEQGLYDAIKIDDLSHEIRILKLRLRRALIAQNKQEEAENERDAMTLVESSGEMGDTHRRVDHHPIIVQLARHIATLIKTRSEVMRDAIDDDAECPQIDHEGILRTAGISTER